MCLHILALIICLKKTLRFVLSTFALSFMKIIGDPLQIYFLKNDMSSELGHIQSTPTLLSLLTSIVAVILPNTHCFRKYFLT